MRVFVDTEFTSLSDPRLISIGAVTETGEHFYAICTDYSTRQCSRFVREIVLPALERHPAQAKGPHSAVEVRWSDWLTQLFDRFGRLELMVDNECDVELIQRLLREAPSGQARWAIRLLPPECADLVSRCSQTFWLAHPECVQHHALDDARALRHRVEAAGAILRAT